MGFLFPQWPSLVVFVGLADVVAAAVAMPQVV